MNIGAAYIRVSTDDQLELSPDSQLAEIRKQTSGSVIIPPEYVFIDAGISGRSAAKRPEFNRMISLAKTKPAPFNTIYLWKFSRFARNQEESIFYKNMLRKQCGVDVVSISEPIADGPFGSLIERIIEWMDEYYSIRLSGEVIRGMTEKANRGEIQTAPSFGYDKPKDSDCFIINEKEAACVRMIFESYLEGESMFAIATRLNAMGVRTKRGNPIEHRQIEYILNNPVYKGYVRWSPEKTVSKRSYNDPRTIVKRAAHDPIISEELWNTVNAKYQDEKSKRKRGARPAETKKHYLSGILKCGSCGSSLAYAQANDGFQCIRYAHGTCRPSHFVSARKIEASVLAELERLCSPGTFIKNISIVKPDNQDKKMFYAAEIESLKKMLDRAKSAFLAGIDTIEEYEGNKRKIQTEIDSLTEKMNTFPAVKAIDQAALKKRLSSTRTFLESDATDEKKSAAIARIVEKIVFHRPDERVDVFLYG